MKKHLNKLFLIIYLTSFAGFAGAQTLTSIYNKKGCGLNYAYASRKITSRHNTGGAGAGFPCDLNIAGLPAGYVIEKAYIWYENSYSNATPLTPPVTVVNPAGTTFNYTAARIAQHIDKCWSEVGTRTYRIDVTNAIAGNGNYRVNVATPVAEVDGITMIVIFRDPSVSYIGNFVLYDGLFSSQGNAFNLTLSGFNACGNSTMANGFLVMGDYQLASHNTTINGTAAIFNDGFWNFDIANTSVSAGQTTSTFATSPLAFDCFAVMLAGLYFRTDCGAPPLAVGGNLNICPGDSTLLTASGGSTYTWSPSATLSSPTGTSVYAKPTVSTTYTVTSTCGLPANITVNVGGPTDMNLSPVNTNCGQSNGSVTVNGVTGGTAPYTYSFNGGPFGATNTFSMLAAGTYLITVKDNGGCEYKENITITDTPGITDVTVNVQKTTCSQSNGVITVTGVTGGSPAYTYAVNGGSYGAGAVFSGLAAGSHTIKVKDANGCLYQENVNVTNIPGPSDLVAAVTDASCGGANGTINITSVSGGASPYSYSLNSSAFTSVAAYTGLVAGSYTVRVKDANGCIYTETINVADSPGPSGINATTTNSNCGNSDGTISITGATGGTPPYSYSVNGGPFSSQTNYPGFSSGSYNIEVKDANGCTFIRGINISDAGGPTDAKIVAQNSICGQNNGSLTVTSITGGVIPYTYSLNGGPYQVSNTFSNLSGGNYSVDIKDKNGCLYSITAIVPVSPGPQSAPLSVTDETCTAANGAIAIISVIGGTSPYTYSLNGGPFIAGSSFANLSAGNHSIVIKDKNNCLLQRDTVITDSPGPNNYSSSVTPEVCKGANGSITVFNVAGGTAPHTFSINSGAFSAGASFNNLSGGSYNITVKDDNGCTYFQNITVTSTAGPTAITPGITNSTCGQSTGSITVNNVTGGTQPYEYSLNGGAFQSSPTFTNLLPGNYTVSVRDANSCIYSEVNNVPDLGGPTAIQLNTTNSTCGLSNASFSITGVTGGTGPYAYSFDGAAYSSQVSYTGLAAGAYPLVVRDNNNCSFSRTVNLADTPGPDNMTIQNTDPVCSVPNGQIEVSSVSNGTQPYTYSIDTVNYQPSQIFSSLQAGEYYVRVKDANNCIYASSVTLTNWAGPTNLTSTKQNPTCGNANGSITAQNVTGGKSPFTYSIDGGPYQAGKAFNNLAAGSHTLAVKDANGCLYSVNINLANIGGPTDITYAVQAGTCGNPNGSIQVTATTGGNTPYQYSLNSGPYQSANQFTNLAAGIYLLTVRDNNSCTYAEQVTVTDIAGPTTINYTTQSSTCGRSNGSVQITGVAGGTSPYSYSVNSGGYSAQNNYTGLLAGTYPITVTDANNCTYTDQFTITDIAGPTDIQTTVSAENCMRKDGAISIAGVAGGTPAYNITLADGTQPVNNSFNNLSTGLYQVIATDANGCAVSKNIDVPYLGYPVAAFTPSTTIGEIPLYINFYNQSLNADTFRWSFGDEATSMAMNPVHSYADTGHYRVRLVAINAAGCTDTAYADIIALLPVEIFIPNAFTPEGDQINDFFTAKTFGITSFTMQVYDRWGTLVGEWDMGDKGWDGLYLGVEVKSDLYIYRFTGIDIYNKKHHRKGTVFLMR